MDFNINQSETIEDPLPPEEVEEWSQNADALFKEFCNSAPDYELNQGILDYKLSDNVTIGEMLTAIKESPYINQFQEHLENKQFLSINSIKLKEKMENLVFCAVDHFKKGLTIKQA